MDMSVGSIARIAATAVPTIVPAAVPAWGPPVVDLFGASVPVASTALSIIGLLMARGVSSAREGHKQPGDGYLTGVLAVILIGIVIDRQPGPGMAVAWGVGIGASGILLIDLLKDRIIALFKGTPK